MADINNNDIWIDVETLARLKNITRRAVRLALNQNKYEYKVENIRGGKTYKIKLSTLEKDLQLNYFQEYYDDYKTCENEVIELSNLNIKQEKLISENQRKIALAKYDLIYAWLDFRKEYKRDKLKTGGNIPDKEFLQLYNTGMFQEEIFKILGKVSTSIQISLLLMSAILYPYLLLQLLYVKLVSLKLEVFEGEMCCYVSDYI